MFKLNHLLLIFKHLALLLYLLGLPLNWVDDRLLVHLRLAELRRRGNGLLLMIRLSHCLWFVLRLRLVRHESCLRRTLGRLVIGVRLDFIDLIVRPRRLLSLLKLLTFSFMVYSTHNSLVFGTGFELIIIEPLTP
jgi:hypothetical protein